MADTQNIAAHQSMKKRERRKLVSGVNAVIALLLLFVVAAMVNYMASRHHWHYDWSRTKFYSVSEKTTTLLAGLTSRVDVIVLFQAGQPLYEHIDNLLKEYEQASPHVKVDRVDPDRDLARTEEIARKYNVAMANVVVFASGERSKFVSSSDMQDIDYSAMLQGGEAEPKAFKGEQAFSSAIEEVTHGRVPVVYFLEGHGEGDIGDRDPSSGFSDLRREVEHDNVEVRLLKLNEAQAVPDDADAVIIAGATRRVPQTEIDLLRKYLDRGGRLIVLLSGTPDPGMDALLAEWGIRTGNDVVVDPSHTLSGLELFIDDYGNHPITKTMKQLATVFYMPRSVEPAAPNGGAAQADKSSEADKPQVETLMRSSATSWAETDKDQKPMRFDPSRDRKGPLSVAVAAEKGAVANLDVEIKPTRLVVFGDSDFVSNFAALSAANADLFLNALNWTLERRELLGIAPKNFQESRLVMDDLQLRLLFWSVVIGLPGIVAIIGGAVWFRRRS